MTMQNRKRLLVGTGIATVAAAIAVVGGILFRKRFHSKEIKPDEE